MSADRLVLLRHGRTPSNAAGIWQGQLDVPLDEVGVAQAARAAVVLAALRPARVVASDLSRAVATATAVSEASGVPLETDPVFREVFAGERQGLTGVQIDERWPAERAAWVAGEDVRLGGGESRAEAAERVVGGLRAAVDETSGTLVVVGHGGSLRSGMLRLLGADEATWLGRMLNCRWAVLTPGRAGWRLDAWNASAPGPDAVSDTGVD